MAGDLDLRRFSPTRPPVVLLGGLNVLRAVALARIPAIVATDQPAAPVLASRLPAGRLVLPRRDNPRALLDALLGLGERIAAALGSRAPLFYGNDDWLALVQEHRQELATRFRLLLNDPEVARALIDKDRFEDFARRRGLPVPRTLAWEALPAHPGPVLVKPKSKLGFDDSPVSARLLQGGKARVFESAAQALEHPLVRRHRGELLFQEYVPGGDRDLWSFHGYSDREGRVLAWFVGRKIRTWPALTGMSSFLELAANRELAALGAKLARRMPLKGVYKMDFKRDAATGRWFLLEVNARFNLWHYLGAANGLNLTQVAYEYLVRQATPGPLAYRRKVRWLALGLDRRAFRDGNLGLVGWLWSLAARPKVYDTF
jgi:predicted ATP-grasp superfamily ATP-dependent carboligase